MQPGPWPGLFPEERGHRMREMSAQFGPGRPSGRLRPASEPVPLLPEIRLAITRLWRTGQRTLLDLRAAPLGPHDERRLFDALQSGLVLNPPRQLGSCRIRETAAPCVWIVEYLDSVGDVIEKFIEINWCPGPLDSAARDDQDPPAAAAGTGADPSIGL
jgi:hypothetical protein